MSGSRIGGLKAAESVKAKYGPDHYRELGARGGKASSGPDYRKGGPKASGFAAMSPERHQALSAKGGKLGKPSPRKNTSPLTLRRNATNKQSDIMLEETGQPNPAML